MSKIILITGASSGIGLSIATYLYSKGLRVYGTSRKVQSGDNQNGIIMVQMDVCDEASVHAGIRFVEEHAGQIDVLINNAGIGMVGPGELSSIEEMKSQFDTNFYGPMRVMQAALPAMRARKSGLIINISSIAAYFGLPYRGVYTAAKSALNGITETMRMELKRFGVHTVVLCPGDFATAIKHSRIEAKATKGSVYEQEFEQVHRLLNEELDSSGDPIVVAKKVERIINSDSPRAYYLAASAFQRFVVHLRYWLPTRLFQRLMMRNYKM